jgi:hypothetical protein
MWSIPVATKPKVDPSHLAPDLLAQPGSGPSGVRDIDHGGPIEVKRTALRVLERPAANIGSGASGRQRNLDWKTLGL